MSGLFQSKQTTPSFTTVSDPYASTREAFTSWLNGQIGKAGPSYTGEMVAPLTAQQKASIPKLEQYANQGTSDLLKNSSDLLNKTLTGGYDPTASPYYQAVKAEAARNSDQANTQIAKDAAGGGNYWTGARLQQQRESATDSANNLNTIIGQLALQERQNQLNAVPVAQNLSNAITSLPLQQASALQSLGGLDQAQQQAIDTALQNMWMQSNYTYPMQIAQLAQPLAGQQPTIAQNGYQPSAFSQISSAVMPLVAAAMMAGTGGTAAAAFPAMMAGASAGTQSPQYNGYNQSGMTGAFNTNWLS